MRDVVVIGAGHNGLVCGAYLSAAGLDIEVLEANDEPGGCVWTEQLDTGHRLELGAIELSGIEQVAADLNLEHHGLKLLSRDILVGAGFSDGTNLLFHSDVDKTLAEMTTVRSAEKQAYRDFADLAGNALRAFDSLPGIPSFAEIIQMSDSISGDVDLGRLLVSSTESVLAPVMNDPYLTSAIGMYGAHAQLPPWLPGTGLFSMLLPGSHGTTASRAEGGSQALIAALVAAVDAAGGAVRTSAAVRNIEFRDGSARVHLDDGETIDTRRVVSSLDVRRTASLLADPSAEIQKAANSVKSGALNISELKIDLALSAPAESMVREANSAIWMLQEQPDSLRKSFGEIVAGTLPTSSAMMWAAPSAMDPTAAPDGGGTVWLSSFVPHSLGGRAWDDAAEEEAADRVLDGFAKITGTDLRPLTIDRRVTGPAGWQQRNGAHGGNPNHIDLSLDQMFGWRPPAMNGYRTDASWLYLTGSATFPGGGVTGIPGRNAARALLGDIGAAPRQAGRWRQEAKGLRDAFGLYRSMRRGA
jgi:beta-carotene ketolase (CrtO type)